MLEELHSDRFVDRSPAQVWATLLDEERYLASERTMYRILAAALPTLSVSCAAYQPRLSCPPRPGSTHPPQRRMLTNYRPPTVSKLLTGSGHALDGYDAPVDEDQEDADDKR